MTNVSFLLNEKLLLVYEIWFNSDGVGDWELLKEQLRENSIFLFKNQAFWFIFL